jgi:hypothetical protein
VGALLLEQNDEWQLQRRYLQLEGLQALTDNQPTRLSAVVSGARVQPVLNSRLIHHVPGHDPIKSDQLFQQTEEHKETAAL